MRLGHFSFIVVLTIRLIYDLCLYISINKIKSGTIFFRMCIWTIHDWNQKSSKGNEDWKKLQLAHHPARENVLPFETELYNEQFPFDYTPNAIFVNLPVFWKYNYVRFWLSFRHFCVRVVVHVNSIGVLKDWITQKRFCPIFPYSHPLPCVLLRQHNNMCFVHCCLWHVVNWKKPIKIIFLNILVLLFL